MKMIHGIFLQTLWGCYSKYICLIFVVLISRVLYWGLYPVRLTCYKWQKSLLSISKNNLRVYYLCNFAQPYHFRFISLPFHFRPQQILNSAGSSLILTLPNVPMPIPDQYGSIRLQYTRLKSYSEKIYMCSDLLSLAYISTAIKPMLSFSYLST